ncbi:hypothetical protein [Novosphingobium sp.]|uniref:hypothetical protein n=1 Tax=Novosphingobium sp. TaxID=1874826 RepID=UPI003D103E6F
MKKMIQAFAAVPISEAIGRSFGGKTLVGTGVALVTARLVMRSFPGMLVLGAVAGGLNYLQAKKISAVDDAVTALEKSPRAA